MQNEMFTREFTLDLSRANKADRSIELSFSSEDPVERWFGLEILDHGKDSIDLSRLNSGSGPLLFNHNADELIGTVTRAWVAGAKARAKVRFGNSKRAKELWADVQEKIIQT